MTLLTNLQHCSDATLRSFFDPKQPIYVARAPGRLDVMGGIADYSGSLVLQMPIAEAASAGIQAVSDRKGVTIASLACESSEATRVFSLNGNQWTELQRVDYATARRRLSDDVQSAWAAYVLGPLLVLMRETGAKLPSGLKVLIDSRVPEGKGVSSSAAVEVATMQAAAELAGVELSGEELRAVVPSCRESRRWCAVWNHGSDDGRIGTEE